MEYMLQLPAMNTSVEMVVYIFMAVVVVLQQLFHQQFCHAYSINPVYSCHAYSTQSPAMAIPTPGF